MKESVKNLLEDEMFVKEYEATFENFLEIRRKNTLKIIQDNPTSSINFKTDFADSLKQHDLMDINKQITEIKLMEDKRSSLPSNIRKILKNIYLVTLDNIQMKLVKNELRG